MAIFDAHEAMKVRSQFRIGEEELWCITRAERRAALRRTTTDIQKENDSQDFG